MPASPRRSSGRSPGGPGRSKGAPTGRRAGADRGKGGAPTGKPTGKRTPPGKGQPRTAGGRPKARSAPPAKGRGRERDRDRGRDDRRGGPRDERPGRSGGRRDDARGARASRGAGRSAVPPPTGRGASWGGLARRGARAGGTAAPMEPTRGRLADAGPSRAAAAFAEAAGRERDEVVDVRVELVEGDGVRDTARRAVRRGAARTAVPEAEPERRSRRAPAALVEELAPEVGGATAPKLAVRLADASRAFEAERFLEARRILNQLVKRAPRSAAVRELLGLTQYRLGKWADAARELEAFRELTGSTEQHPVLADCYRALGRYAEVEDLWRELREVSPSPDLVAEGRIVWAGTLADQGELRRAIAEVEVSTRRIKAVRRPHHLRLLYVLGDLYERAGDVPRARAAFDRVLAAAPDFADAAARRRAL